MLLVTVTLSSFLKVFFCNQLPNILVIRSITSHYSPAGIPATVSIAFATLSNNGSADTRLPGRVGTCWNPLQPHFSLLSLVAI